MEDEFLKKYYTESGVNALKNRLKNVTELYLKDIEYPVVFRMMGFPLLKIHSKQHHEGMIDELTQILNIDKVEVEINGSKK